MRTNLYRGLLAGAMASLASVIYMNVYSAALVVDFSAVAKPVGIVASTFLGTLLAALGLHFWQQRVKQHATLLFNMLFTVLTFTTIAPVFGMPLPLSVVAPELFPGMAIPMHFFPQLFWHVSEPMFVRERVRE